jgi:DNA-binding transcriptional MerR regulator
MLSGLTIPALRHYDDVGILLPAQVDRRTGYRYYRRDQLPRAQLILALRAVDLPIDEVRDAIDAPEVDLRGLLLAHRERLADQSARVSQQLVVLDGFIEKGVIVPKVTGSRIVMLNVAVHDADVARRFYEDVFGASFNETTHDGPHDSHYEGTFGTWPTENFFLLQIFEDVDRAGTANFGFFCEDLEETYRESLAAGAIDVHGPKDVPGMPRVAQIKDPSGNDIGLYQA